MDHVREGLAGVGALVGVLLIAAVAWAGQASHAAVSVNPDNTAVTGAADTPILDYEGVPYMCDEGVATGTTGTNTDFVDVELTFSGNCNVNGLPANDIDCDGTARLQALNGRTNTGELDNLSAEFRCEVVVPDLCTITVQGPQELPLPGGVSHANLLNEGTSSPDIDVVVDLWASADNPTWCGPNEEVLGLTALYSLNQPISFD
jgi:hypothetical protein